MHGFADFSGHIVAEDEKGRRVKRITQQLQNTGQEIGDVADRREYDVTQKTQQSH